MSKSMKQLVGEARENVGVVSPKEAHSAARGGDLILDVREPVELEKEGRVDGALHIPRGILESRACSDAETSDKTLFGFRDSARVHVLCASGARAALAADTLRVMGYNATVIDGGFKGWKDDGLPVTN